jgi:hypothetical protein
VAGISASLAAPAVQASPAHAAARGADDHSAAWLAGQLDGGLIHNDQYAFDDYGLTADTAFALRAIGGQADAVRAIRKALAAHVDSWTTGVDFGSSDVYAGSTAKAVVLAEVTGADPRAFGGVDLVQRLNRRISTAPGVVGRLNDKSATDYANVIGQGFAVRGLADAKSGKADEALRFLLAQQCASGYFRLNFAAPDASDQTCDGGKRATTSAPDTDVTALTVLALDALPTKLATSTKVRAARTDAVSWLRRHQKANGSFGGGPATEASNSNSTGLASWALGESAACGAAAQAAQWVQHLQVSGNVSGTPLAGEKGAIAYDSDRYAAAKQSGIGTEDRDQWRRATAQAAPALLFPTAAACQSR